MYVYLIVHYRWWQTDSGKCPSMSDSGKKPTDTEELKLENVAGIFFVLVGGLVLGLLACLFDKFFVVCRRNRQVRRDVVC